MTFAARLGRRAAANGVTTVPGFRGPGFAAAATAGRAAHPTLRGFTLFYGSSPANTSPQCVAERLALRYLGASLSITRETTARLWSGGPLHVWLVAYAMYRTIRAID